MTINQIIYEMFNQDSTPCMKNVNKSFNKSNINVNDSLMSQFRTMPSNDKKVELRASKLHGITTLTGNKKI